jgi:hypothetical protein
LNNRKRSAVSPHSCWTSFVFWLLNNFEIRCWNKKKIHSRVIAVNSHNCFFAFVERWCRYDHDRMLMASLPRSYENLIFYSIIALNKHWSLRVRFTSVYGFLPPIKSTHSPQLGRFHSGRFADWKWPPGHNWNIAENHGWHTQHNVPRYNASITHIQNGISSV